MLQPLVIAEKFRFANWYATGNRSRNLLTQCKQFELLGHSGRQNLWRETVHKYRKNRQLNRVMGNQLSLKILLSSNWR